VNNNGKSITNGVNMMAFLQQAKERSLIPPVVEGKAAAKIIADFSRPATELEVAVVQRGVKNQVKRRNRTGKVGIEFAVY
jgi:hypothetical protein